MKTQPHTVTAPEPTGLRERVKRGLVDPAAVLSRPELYVGGPLTPRIRRWLERRAGR